MKSALALRDEEQLSPPARYGRAMIVANPGDIGFSVGLSTRYLEEPASLSKFLLDTNVILSGGPVRYSVATNASLELAANAIADAVTLSLRQLQPKPAEIDARTLALVSEKSLAFWATPEEDRAWAHLDSLPAI